jgi:hypothetical protein
MTSIYLETQPSSLGLSHFAQQSLGQTGPSSSSQGQHFDEPTFRHWMRISVTLAVNSVSGSLSAVQSDSCLCIPRLQTRPHLQELRNSGLQGLRHPQRLTFKVMFTVFSPLFSGQGCPGTAERTWCL